MQTLTQANSKSVSLLYYDCVQTPTDLAWYGLNSDNINHSGKQQNDSKKLNIINYKLEKK